MKGKILLHICCAPDGTTSIERLKKNFEVIGYFGNSNIQPYEEYKMRKDAVNTLSEYYDIEVLYGEYQPEKWLKEMKGLETLTEGNARCRKCIYCNLLETAEKASELAIPYFTTSLMTSPHKDVAWIKTCGEAIEKGLSVNYYHEIFRKQNGFLNSVQKSKSMGLYRQNYCGCLYSIYDK